MLLEKLTLLLEEKGYLKNPETGKIEPGSLDTALKQYFDKILKDLNKEDLDEVVQDKSQYEKYLEAIIEYASNTYSGEPVIDYIKTNKSRLITRLMSVDALSESIDEQEEDSIEDIQKQLDALGIKYEMSKADKVRPFKAIYKPINKPDGFYNKFENIVDLYNLKGVVKTSMNEVQEEDPIDTITMDVPLFIRLLEYAREDAQDDMDLHDLAEKAIAGTKQQGILSMDDYDMLVGELEQINTSEIAKEIYETIQLGKQLNEAELCQRGKDYIAARKRAGEKSSAYLSGRAVRVCKGDIEFKGKKQKDFKG